MSLENILNYKFQNRSLLEEALTHPGCAEIKNKLPFNYQRLEFLGDSVLGLIAAEMLFKLYPKESEGNLAKRQAALVRSESLAAIARKIGLGDYIKIAINDNISNTRENDSGLEDVCESIIGALYLDGGLVAAKNFVATHLEPLARSMNQAPKDAKTALQEWSQGRGLDLPIYSVLETKGPSHAPEFTVEVVVGGEQKATAKAGSKRQAEQAAAKLLLDNLQII